MAWCLLDVKPFPEPELTVNLDPYKNQQFSLKNIYLKML